jgi:hypothetical protein
MAMICSRRRTVSANRLRPVYLVAVRREFSSRGDVIALSFSRIGKYSNTLMARRAMIDIGKRHGIELRGGLRLTIAEPTATTTYRIIGDEYNAAFIPQIETELAQREASGEDRNLTSEWLARQGL